MRWRPLAHAQCVSRSRVRHEDAHVHDNDEDGEDEEEGAVHHLGTQHPLGGQAALPPALKHLHLNTHTHTHTHREQTLDLQDFVQSFRVSNHMHEPNSLVSRKSRDRIPPPVLC